MVKQQRPLSLLTLEFKPCHRSQVIHLDLQELEQLFLDFCEGGSLVGDISLDVGATAYVAIALRRLFKFAGLCSDAKPRY